MSRDGALARHEADIALRFGALKDSALLSRHLGTIALGDYASRAYRDKHDVRAPVLIGYEDRDFVPEAT